MTANTDTDIEAATSLFYQANSLMAEGQLDDAEQAYLQALQLAPDLAEIYANLAWLRTSLGHLVQAEQDYRQALQLAPDNLQIRLNFAVMLAALKRFDEAEQHYRVALTQDGNSVYALSNLGVLLASVQREEEAEICYRKALALAPDYPKAAFNLAYLLLRQGRYEEGWCMLEARDSLGMQTEFFSDQHHVTRWQGEDLHGKVIIIAFESGHGDMLQFMRYARLLKQGGAAKVSCLCHPALVTVLASMPELDEVLALNDAIAITQHVVKLDYWVPLFSLPGLFHTKLDTLPDHIPYLYADPIRLQHWSGLIAQAGPGLRVGLVWKGNPRFYNDADRSIHDLRVLQPLADLPGVLYFSLQKGGGETDLTSPSMPLKLIDVVEGVADFADTAAIIMQLDLVITVDTAVAHLAAALGKTCWILLAAHQPDWRWLKERDESPWYPKLVSLFRQTVMGDWGSVIGKVKASLLKLQTEIATPPGK